jgi:hypothetical protein
MLFEGFTEDEILNLPAEAIERMILLGEPLVFRVGSATILGSFRVDDNSLIFETSPNRWGR